MSSASRRHEVACTASTETRGCMTRPVPRPTHDILVGNASLEASRAGAARHLIIRVNLSMSLVEPRWRASS